MLGRKVCVGQKSCTLPFSVMLQNPPLKAEANSGEANSITMLFIPGCLLDVSGASLFLAQY